MIERYCWGGAAGCIGVGKGWAGRAVLGKYEYCFIGNHVVESEEKLWRFNLKQTQKAAATFMVQESV